MPVPRPSLWLIAVVAFVVFAAIFVLQGVPDQFLVLRNAATFSASQREYLAGQVALVAVFQAFVIGVLHWHLHVLDRRVRGDHVTFLVLFVWGSLVWPVTAFADAYWDYEYWGQGSWRASFDLAFFSVPLSLVALIVMIVRGSLIGRMARV